MRINREIRAPRVRVIDKDGEQVGVLPTGEAIYRAEQAGLDLVEISPN
ncbi:MAG TPA: translation initiation factor IF-3, partial [Rhabdochlamydiaceae bacterium]